MGKYIAVIKDSFREALASRVMWFVLIGITLVLLALVPFGFREVLTIHFRQDDLRRPDDFMIALRKEGTADKPGPARAIWLQLEEKTRKRLAKLSIPIPAGEMPFEYFEVLGEVTQQISKRLPSSEFYDREAWKDVRIASDEARELHRRLEGQGKEAKPLSADETTRLNRLLLEAAFPESIRSSPPTSVQFTYVWMNVGSPIPLGGSTIRDWMRNSVTWILGFLVGSIGIYVALLVTSPIIPQMFDAGSLHLMLSKPVSRWLLFLSKYLGGCAFIFIFAAYLIGGLWLILGLRFGIWDMKLLASIPIYLFMFAIYYSVSSLAAVIWRSAVVSIAIAVVFELSCMGVGSGKNAFESLLVHRQRFTQVFYVNDKLFAADEFGWGMEWEPAQEEWVERFVIPEQRRSRPFILWTLWISSSTAVPREFRTVGPIYDETTDRMLAVIPAFPPTKSYFAVATRGDRFEPTSPLTAPMGSLKFLREPTGKILLVSSLGLSRIAGDPLAKQEPVKVFGFSLPIPGGGPFQIVNPDPPVLLTQPADAAIHPTSGEVALYSRGKITILAPYKNKYELKSEHKLDGKDQQAAVLAIAGKHLLVGREDGRVQAIDRATMQNVGEWNPEGRNPPRFIDASKDGRWFSIVFHTGRLWLFDAEKGEIQKPIVAGQGTISAANFSPDGQLLVVDRTDRVSEYSLTPLRLEKRFVPNSGLLLNTYRWGLVPLYTIFPKPGALDETFDYFLSGTETEKGGGDSDLTGAHRVIDPWGPLWSSGLFTLVVLAIACAYIEWQEF